MNLLVLLLFLSALLFLAYAVRQILTLLSGALGSVQSLARESSARASEKDKIILELVDRILSSNALPPLLPHNQQAQQAAEEEVRSLAAALGDESE